MSLATCLIVSSEPLVCLGLRHLLVLEAGLRVCGEAATASEALYLQELHRPFLVVISSLHGEDLTLIRDLHRGQTVPGILVVAHQANAQQVPRALRAGARGYVTLEDNQQELLRAIAAVRADSLYVSHRASEGLMTRLAQPGGSERELDSLSDREMEIFQLMSNGLGSKQIAGYLNISVKTVETHKQRMKDKLNLNTCAELNRHAFQNSGQPPTTRRRTTVA